MARSSLLLAIFLILESCVAAATPVNRTDVSSPEERRSVVRLPIYNEGELNGKEYAVVNMVEGTSCTNKRRDSEAIEVDAVNQAKHVAQDKGAEGIKNLQCHLSRAMTASNRLETITCRGQGIKFAK